MGVYDSLSNNTLALPQSAESGNQRRLCFIASGSTGNVLWSIEGILNEWGELSAPER